MYVIGITGGVGAGKSAVLSILSECVECEIIRADDVANRLKLKGQPCFDKIVDLLGEQILGSDGEIDRNLMSMIVFEDDAKMKRVEQILHPQVKRYITENLNRLTIRNETEFVIKEKLQINKSPGTNSFIGEVY